MKADWLYAWQKSVGKYVNMPGNASCSQNLKIALDFAITNLKQDNISVLFVISCQNYNSPSGIRMNNKAYSSFPSESEILLMEGCLINILAVEEEVLISNNLASFVPFKNKKITIVHLYH